MPRKPRLHYPGALYHVIIRGNARQDIFFEDQDRFRFYLLLQEGVERFGHRIISFCLMTNHVHLAIQVGDTSLSRIMQNLSFRYTRWINWRRNRSGHLFQGRYKALLVDGESYLLELAAYLHLNPLRAGMIEDPVDYRWSSHRAYLGKETVPWLNTDFVLGQFSGNRITARQKFREYVAGKTKEGHREEFHGKTSSDSRFIGEDSFVDSTLRQKEPLFHEKPDVEAILDCVVRLYGLTRDELSAQGQKRVPSEARMLAAWAVREMSDSTLAELAQKVGREASAMSAAAARFDARRRRENDLAVKGKQLKKKLEVSFFQA